MDVSISALKTWNAMKRSAGNMLSYMAAMTAAPTAEANINTNTSSVRYLFFFNPSPLTLVYTLSLHDALPIYVESGPTLSIDPDVLRVIDFMQGQVAVAAV